MSDVVKRQWRERRGDGWSATVYSGLYFSKLGSNGLLVSKLSHGLRVLDAGDPRQYDVISSEPVAEVSPNFIKEVLQAYEADKRFQRQLSAYEAAMA